MTDNEQSTVMLIDDTPANLQLLESILEGEGFKVRSFLGGQLALQSARLLPPDLVLLDINMPEMDGFEVCRVMKSEPTLKNIPIIFISASHSFEDVMKAFEYGAVDYVSKPFNSREVLARVSTHLTLHQLQAEMIIINKSLEHTIKQRTKRLYESEERLRYALHAANEGIYDLDLELGMIYRSPKLLQMLGLDSQEMKIDKSFITELVHPDDKKNVDTFVKSLLKGKQNTYQIRYRLKNKKGTEIWILNQCEIVERSPTEEPKRAVGTVTDITEQVEYENELKRLATHDSITNLPNLALLQELVAQKMQDESIQFGVLYIGFKEFGKIVESTDHSVAEQALKQIVQRIQENIIENAILAKLDGPEFAVLTSEYLHESDLASQANLIIYKFTSAITVNSQDFLLTPHIGISVPKLGNSAEIILRNAATAMTHALEEKEVGYVYHSKAMNERVQHQIELENNIKKGLENKEFINYYQPKICLKSGKIIGAEALVRWQHPEQGLVSPFEFIPVAESSGQIKELGRQVFENVVRNVSDWQKDLDFKGKIAINLSAKQFSEPELLSNIQGFCERYQIDPHYFELEVTESVLLTEVETAIKTLNNFKKMGFTIAIDDFGTGYSSLSYLRDMPFDTLKLDKSFIDDIAISPKSRTLVESIVQLAIGLELEVVAEGVETIEQAELLQKMKCGQCQGYLFSKPVDEVAFTALISQSKSYPLPLGTSD